MKQMETGQVTEALATYVVTARPEDVPDAVRDAAIRTLLNWVGGAVGGAGSAAIDAMLAAFGPFMGAPQASVLGRSERTDVLHASLLNGSSCNVLDYDDTHLRTVIHPAAPIAPALLALAEHRPISGGELIHALILGIETACRVGNGISPEHYEHGWHITGTAGVLGAAAASGRLLGLDVQRMRWAIGTAATQAAGLREMFGSMCRVMHAGRAAQNGLSAALLSQHGFTGSEQGLEAPAGFLNVLSPKQDVAAITDGLGETYETALNTFKPFASGIVTHPAIDGCIRIRREHGFQPEEVERVALDVHPLALVLTDDPSPRTGLEARLSIQHVAATALVLGRAGAHDFADEMVERPDLARLRASVEARADEGLARDQARVRIALAGGRTVETFVEHAYGSIENPMTDADLDRKVHELCDSVLGEARTDALIEKCRGVLDLPSAATIAEAAVP